LNNNNMGACRFHLDLLYPEKTTLLEAEKRSTINQPQFPKQNHIFTSRHRRRIFRQYYPELFSTNRAGGHGEDKRIVEYESVFGDVSLPMDSTDALKLLMIQDIAAYPYLDVMAVRGENAPEGWLIKKDGSWSTDPASQRTGEASPTCFGYPYSEYKGYGLSVVVEAWAGAIGAGCSLDEKGFGHVFTAIDPTGYCPIEEFKARMDSMVRHMKSAAKRPGFDEVLLPGEREWIEEERRQREGIFVDDPWWKSILKTVKSLGVDADRVIKG